MHSAAPSSVRSHVRHLVILSGVALFLGGCASIPPRALANGAAMGPQRPLQFQNLHDMSTMRATYYRAAPLRLLGRQKPYQPFGTW